LKPYSEACERNKAPILAVLREVFADVSVVLEIGSGTGQHAVHFAAALPQLTWHCSDLIENHAGINMWREAAGTPNLSPPLALNVDQDPWPVPPGVDAVFTANTLHIVSWPRVERLFAGAGRALVPGDPFCVYGPFSYGGEHTSQSNARFDEMLRLRDPDSGIRDLDALVSLGGRTGFELVDDRAMPANNRLLIWRRAESAVI